MRVRIVTTATQNSQVQDGPSTVQVSTTPEQRGNQCRSGQRSESPESMALSGCTCTLVYYLSSRIKPPTKRKKYTFNLSTFDTVRHLLHLFWSQFQEVKPRSQTTEKKQKYNCFWQKFKRTCQNRDFCNADRPVGAEGSRPLLQGIVELLRIPSELTLNQQIHRAGMVAVVFQHELLPWKGEEILSDQCCCVSRKRSENQIKLNFHESLGPMTNQEGKFLIVSYSFCPFHFIA